MTYLAWSASKRVSASPGVRWPRGNAARSHQGACTIRLAKDQLLREVTPKRVTDQYRRGGTENVEERFPSELSGGMRKRVGLARALMLEPEAILYDEPTSGLDPITSRKVDDLIVETRDRYGVTSIVISHDMAGALRIADQIVLLSRGRVVAAGRPRELVARGAELLKEFIDSSGIEVERLLGERNSTAPPRPRV